MIEASAIYDFIIENQLATEESLDLLTSVAGFSDETLNQAIYALTGFHDVEQLYMCARKEFCFNDKILSELKK